MTLTLLDTPTLIDFSKGREPVRSRLRAALLAGDRLATCAIVVAEFFTGIGRGERPDWDRFIDTLVFLPMTRAVAEQAGAWRRQFRMRGVQLTTADTLIAATASVHGALLVSENVRDFPMPDLQVISWRNTSENP